MADPGALDLSERRLLERGADVQLDAPWNPLPELKAGDRVVVRMSGECEHCRRFNLADQSDLNGRTGTVVNWPHTHTGPVSPHDYGHDITVELDEDVFLPSLGRYAWGGCFARAELQRIAEAEAGPPNGA